MSGRLGHRTWVTAAADAALLARREPRRTVVRLVATSFGLLVAVVLITLGASGRASVDRAFERWSERGFSVAVAPERAHEVWADRAGVAERLAQGRGVASVGPVLLRSDAVVSMAVSDPPLAERSLRETRVALTTPGALSALDAVTSTPVTQLPVDGVLLGSRLAADLDLGGDLAAGPITLEIDGHVLPVVGTLQRSPRRTDLLSSVVVVSPDPAFTGSDAAPDIGDLSYEVRTVPGTARAVAAMLPVAISPAHPEGIVTLEAPDLRALRRTVGAANYRSGALVATAVSLFGAAVVGAVGYGQVATRRHEIGVRRVCGATAVDVALLVAVDAAVVGLTGGVLAASLGSAVSTTLMQLRDLPLVVVWWPIFAAPVAGMLLGLGAGIPAAHRAARVPPRVALHV